MRVAVVAEFYPRRHDPVLGVWAHRQALAARDAGAELSVFVLHRLVPPAAAVRSGRLVGDLRRLLDQPPAEQLDGIDVRYVRYVSPPRNRGYAGWGRWAAPVLGRALRRAGPFDLIHAHNAVPAADTVLRTGSRAPLVVSVHGGDVLFTSDRLPGGRAAVERALGAARLVLVNSAGVAALAADHGAARTLVVRLGADRGPDPAPRSPTPLLVSVGHLVGRKRHADVLRALADLPGVGYLVIGDGPERAPLERLAAELGVAERVEFAGQLAPAEALRRVSEGWVFAMPSTEEAFGVAYVEAMAAGLPAVGLAGEPGPAEIAAAGEGLVVVERPRLGAVLGELLGDPARLAELGAAARLTAETHFSWEACGRATLAAYAEALA